MSPWWRIESRAGNVDVPLPLNKTTKWCRAITHTRRMLCNLWRRCFRWPWWPGRDDSQSWLRTIFHIAMAVQGLLGWFFLTRMSTWPFNNINIDRRASERARPILRLLIVSKGHATANIFHECLHHCRSGRRHDGCLGTRSEVIDAQSLNAWVCMFVSLSPTVLWPGHSHGQNLPRANLVVIDSKWTILVSKWKVLPKDFPGSTRYNYRNAITVSRCLKTEYIFLQWLIEFSCQSECIFHFDNSTRLNGLRLARSTLSIRVNGENIY